MRLLLKPFFILRYLIRPDVDDLLQEILIKTQNNISNINSKESVKPWLFKITNNTVIDFYRKRARQRDLTAEDLWYDEADLNLQQSLVRCVEPFINALPVEDGDLLKSFDINGESQKEYAESKGISYSTLKSRVQKSRGQTA